MDVIDNSTDKEDSSVGKKSSSKSQHDGDGLICGSLATNSAISTKSQYKQVPADDGSDNEIEMDMHVDAQNAGIRKETIISKAEDVDNKMAHLNVKKQTHNDTSAAVLTPSTTEDQSQSPSFLRGDDMREMEDKTQSPTCLTSPAASTPATTPNSSPTGQKPNSSGANSPENNQKNVSKHASPSQRQHPVLSDQSTATTVGPATGGDGGGIGGGGGGNCIQQPINVVRNGTIPNAGKPLLSTMSKKLEKSAKASRTRKPRSSVAMYESEISENKIGIKLCIKKSESSLSAATAVAMAAVVKGINKSASSTSTRSRKSSRSQKQRIKLQPDSLDEGDEVDYEPRRKKDRNTKRQTSSSATAAATATNEWEEHQRPVVDQGIWGSQLPEHVLSQIFENVVNQEGCLPTLPRLGRVCSLWRRVSLSPKLWKTMDLSTWIKEKYRTELKLKWFVDNRCTYCTELNVSNWKVSDINCFLMKLSAGAPNLTSITLSGWKDLTCDHLAYLVENMKKLERLDLSSVNVEMNANKSAVGLQSLCNALQVMGSRLTHLYLADNRLAGIPQIVNVLSTHCPNLVILDLSNVTTQATSHGILHVEKLQQGCPKLKVLRITNSHITLSTASLQEQMDSPGFPELEELSVAVTDESRVIGDEHIQRILKKSSKLKLLDVRGCARLTHESLIRLPAWDIKHLFLSGCSVTRDMGSGLELIASKWAHSLIELDLAWANVQHPLDAALRALADKGAESRLAHLNLCGSSVSEEAVKEILANCPLMSTINLASCRGLPRGVKRQMQGPKELNELRDALKVQLKVKLPEMDNSTTSSSANASDGGGGGAAAAAHSP